MSLLDFYRSRFGRAVKRQGNGWNGPCPLCGGQPGKSDRFMVWPDRSENLGKVCEENGIKGIWACRQCGASGDTIAWLTKIDGMTFKEALGELGIQAAPVGYRHRRAPREQDADSLNSWSPKAGTEPSSLWREHALKLVEEGEKKIWNNAAALRWLAARGLDEAAVRKYRLGYLEAESSKYPGRFRQRKAFGLPAKIGHGGKIHDKLFIPRGIVIPTFNHDGAILNLRIRRPKADTGQNLPKYLELEGSSRATFFIRSSLARRLAVYFVTEAELDAMLVHHAGGGVVGALAVRTNRGKPDASCHARLEEAVRVCVALDYDGAGAEGCGFWEENYSNSRRWPVPEGKDPGDAFALGVDIRQWIAAALPASVNLPGNADIIHRSGVAQKNQDRQEHQKNGHLEALPSGRNNLGEGAKANLKGMDNSGQAHKRQCLAVPAHVDSFAQLPLPAGVSHKELLRALASHSLDDPECILPCPKTRPPFWWGYYRDCSRLKCQGHPQCLLGILQSPLFTAALKNQEAL